MGGRAINGKKKINANIEIKINVKGNGQECPFHTATATASQQLRCNRSWFPLLAKDVRNRAPRPLYLSLDVQPVYSNRGEGKKTYTARDIDVLAAHVRVEGKGLRRKKDVWYLLPIAAFEGVKSLRFYPGKKSENARWEGYREGWEWLRE